MFRSTAESFPAAFLEGDVFDSAFLTAASPVATSTHVSTDALPELKTLTSLTPLQGHVSGIFTGNFFHLFTFEQQYQLAKSLAGLLSPEPGSILIGNHRGLPKKEVWQASETTQYKMCCHSPESWTEMWYEIFSNGQGGDGGVEVKAQLRDEIGGPTYFGTFPNSTKNLPVLEWSVVRK